MLRADHKIFLTTAFFLILAIAGLALTFPFIMRHCHDSNSRVYFNLFTGVNKIVSDHDIDKLADVIEKHPELINQKDFGLTPLQSAIHMGDVAIVEYLVRKGASVYYDDSEVSYLYMVAERGCFPFEEFSTPCEQRDINADYPSIKIAGILIDTGVKLDNKGGEQASIIHAAVLCGSTSLVRFLISKGADVNEQDNDGTSPLMRAAVKREYCNNTEMEQMIKLLMENGADIELRNNKGENVMQMARRANKTNVVAVIDKFTN